MQTPPKQDACADPKIEGPWGGRIPRALDDLLVLTKNSYSTKKYAKCKIPIYNSHARTQKERVPEEAESCVFLMTFYLMKNNNSSKNMQNANSPETERMHGPKKRGTLRRPNPACSRWPFSFNEEQLFTKKHAKCKLPRHRTHAWTQKERVPEEAESRVFPMTF